LDRQGGHVRRIAAYALPNDMTKEKAAKIIHAAEQQRAMYQHIQRVVGKGHTGGINKVWWRPIFDQKEITQRLIERNQEHFGQAEGTPFTTGEVHDILGWDSLTEEGVAILAGTFDVESLATDNDLKAILRKLGEQQ
jgi:hypothetical protein